MSQYEDTSDECKFTKDILLWVEGLATACKVEVNLNPRNVIFNQVATPKKHVINFLILVAKQFIYRCKCQDVKPTVSNYKNEIKMIYLIEHHNVVIQGKGVSWVQYKWRPVQYFLSL